MKKTRNHTLRAIDPRELTRVRGGLLLPAVQKIREPVARDSAGTIYMKFDSISGDATEN